MTMHSYRKPRCSKVVKKAYRVVLSGNPNCHLLIPFFIQSESRSKELTIQMRFYWMSEVMLSFVDFFRLFVTHTPKLPSQNFVLLHSLWTLWTLTSCLMSLFLSGWNIPLALQRKFTRTLPFVEFSKRIPFELEILALDVCRSLSTFRA